VTFSINKYTRALTFPDLKKTKAVFAEQCPLVRRLVLRDNKLFSGIVFILNIDSRNFIMSCLLRRLVLRDNKLFADTFFFFLRRLVIIDNKLFADIVFIVFV
jgi:hypothetical protein